MPNWKKVVVSGSDATLNSLYTTGDITSSGDIFVSSSKSYYLGANSYLRRETNGGGFESIQLNGSIRLNPNTSANANNGVVIGGNGYLLAPNSSRNAQLNYGSVSGQLGVFRLNVYGGDSIFQQSVDITGSLEVLGGITGSLLGTASYATQALSASYAPGTSQTLQQVTDNGNTTTNSAVFGELTVTSTGSQGNISIGTPTFANILRLSSVSSSFPSSNIVGLGIIQMVAGSDPATNIVPTINLTLTDRYTAGQQDILKVQAGSAPYSASNGTVYISRNNTSPVTDKILAVSGSAIFYGGDVEIEDWGSISASLASISSSSSNLTLQQVTDNGNITSNDIIITGSSADSLRINSEGFIISGSLSSGPSTGKTHQVIYSALSVNANSTTTIAQLPAPVVAGFTFDYIAYVSGNVIQAGRAGVVKGILRNTDPGVITKAFQINETTTLDLEDQGFGTDGLQFTIVQDTNGTSNQLVAITNNVWPYEINYTLTIYYNPNFS